MRWCWCLEIFICINLALQPLQLYRELKTLFATYIRSGFFSSNTWPNYESRMSENDQNCSTPTARARLWITRRTFRFINYTPISLTWSAGSWRWSGFLQSRWSSLEFAECPALWAGSQQHRSDLNCLSNWRKQKGMSVRTHSFSQKLLFTWSIKEIIVTFQPRKYRVCCFKLLMHTMVINQSFKRVFVNTLNNEKQYFSTKSCILFTNQPQNSWIVGC